MALIYGRADERPHWVANVTVNGVEDNMASGYTFEVKIATSLTATPLTTKTTNITGGTGTVTVAWSGTDLDLTPGDYVAQLKVTRTSDSADWTITEPLRIRARL